MGTIEQPSPSREHVQRERECSRPHFRVGPWGTPREIKEKTAWGQITFPRNSWEVHSKITRVPLQPQHTGSRAPSFCLCFFPPILSLSTLSQCINGCIGWQQCFQFYLWKAACDFKGNMDFGVCYTWIQIPAPFLAGSVTLGRFLMMLNPWVGRGHRKGLAYFHPVPFTEITFVLQWNVKAGKYMKTNLSLPHAMPPANIN